MPEGHALPRQEQEYQLSPTYAANASIEFGMIIIILLYLVPSADNRRVVLHGSSDYIHASFADVSINSFTYT